MHIDHRLSLCNLAAQSLVLLFASVLLSGCVSEGVIRIGAAKVYDDDQVRRTYSERRAQLRGMAKDVHAGRLQSSFSVRQGVRYDGSIVGSQVGSDVEAFASAPEEPIGKDLVLPTAPTAPDGLGLTYTELYRDLVLQDQFVTGYELLYLGDAGYNHGANRVALLRLDVALTGNLRGGSKPKFALARFSIAALDSNDNEVRGLRVYSLAPEFDAIATQESFASTFVQDFEGRFGGNAGAYSLQGAGRFQKQLEETLVSLTQTPLQFGVPLSDTSFAFAFGPRRTITRRGPLNPCRWFGNTYRIDYEISPGPRTCWALVVVPTTEKIRLNVVAEFAKELVEERDEDLLKDQGWNIPLTFSGIKSSCPLPGEGEFKRLQGLPNVEAFGLTTAELAKIPSAPEPPKDYDLYPAVDTILTLRTKRVMTGEAVVTIGPYQVAPEDVHVLGRHSLSVRIPKDSGLAELAKQKLSPVVGRIDIPGHFPAKDAGTRFNVNLVTKKGSPTHLKLTPTHGNPGDWIQISSTQEFSRWRSVEIGGEIVWRKPDTRGEAAESTRLHQIGAKTARLQLPEFSGKATVLVLRVEAKGDKKDKGDKKEPAKAEEKPKWLVFGTSLTRDKASTAFDVSPAWARPGEFVRVTSRAGTNLSSVSEVLIGGVSVKKAQGLEAKKGWVDFKVPSPTTDDRPRRLPLILKSAEGEVGRTSVQLAYPPPPKK